jgi:hypothetical protein
MGSQSQFEKNKAPSLLKRFLMKIVQGVRWFITSLKALFTKGEPVHCKNTTEEAGNKIPGLTNAQPDKFYSSRSCNEAAIAEVPRSQQDEPTKQQEQSEVRRPELSSVADLDKTLTELINLCEERRIQGIKGVICSNMDPQKKIDFLQEKLDDKTLKDLITTCDERHIQGIKGVICSNIATQEKINFLQEKLSEQKARRSLAR